MGAAVRAAPGYDGQREREGSGIGGLRGKSPESLGGERRPAHKPMKVSR